jgi:hypothetical protein
MAGCSMEMFSDNLTILRQDTLIVKVLSKKAAPVILYQVILISSNQLPSLWDITLKNAQESSF